MIIEIDDTKKVIDIQERFSMCFPGLKLEVCNKKHGWNDMCSEGHLVEGEKDIASIRKNHEPGIIEIKSWSKVGEVEKEFYLKFGLSVQICYKLGDRWVQSSGDDNLSISSLQKKSYTNQDSGLL